MLFSALSLFHLEANSKEILFLILGGISYTFNDSYKNTTVDIETR